MTVVLGIATATPQVGIALGTLEDGAIAELKIRGGRRHGELLAPAIRDLTQLSGIALSDVDLVAVDTGPGLFTGLRVGIATAKALASALGLQVVACSSLDLLAYPHRHVGTRVASVVDARRGEVFWSVHEPSSGADTMISVTESVVSDPETLAGALADERSIVVTGDGGRRYEKILRAVPNVTIAGEEHDHPAAASLIELAASRAALPPEKVSANYLRGADVRIGWEQRDG
jgi:tRNA threonylcarbamoyladenosine biosynthesis protein TsaB